MPILKQSLPAILFLLIAIALWRGLSLHPEQVPSPLIGKKAPSFQLPTLANAHTMTSNQDFVGHVTLLNVWATWCFACLEEHEFLLQLSHEEPIFLYGLNYKDDPTLAKKWLQKNGNPYQKIAVGLHGNVAIDWGVYGTPETFVIDKKGIIRYKHVGPMTAQVWNEHLNSLVQQLQQESI